MLRNSPLSPPRSLCSQAAPPTRSAHQECEDRECVENGFWPVDPWYLGKISPEKYGSSAFSCSPAHEEENLH